MPLWDEYQGAAESGFPADMANIGGGQPGGSVTAACFLSYFHQDHEWAHLDIAGTAWKSKGQGRDRPPGAAADTFLIGPLIGRGVVPLRGRPRRVPEADGDDAQHDAR